MLITKVISPGQNVIELDFHPQLIAIKCCVILRNPKPTSICYLLCKEIERESVEWKNILAFLYLPESGPVGCIQQYFTIKTSHMELELIPKSSRVQLIMQFSVI